MMSDLLSSIVEKLGKYLAGPDRGGDAVGHMIDDVGGGVAELASGERLDVDAFHSDHAVNC